MSLSSRAGQGRDRTTPASRLLPTPRNSHRTTDVKSCARRLPASVPDPMAQRTPKDSRALAAAAAPAAPQVCGLQVDVPRRRLAGSASAGPALRMPLARGAARRVRPRVRLAQSAATAPIDSPRPGVTPPRTWTPPVLQTGASDWPRGRSLSGDCAPSAGEAVRGAGFPGIGAAAGVGDPTWGPDHLQAFLSPAESPSRPWGCGVQRG